MIYRLLLMRYNVDHSVIHSEYTQTYTHPHKYIYIYTYIHYGYKKVDKQLNVVYYILN